MGESGETAGIGNVSLKSRVVLPGNWNRTKTLLGRVKFDPRYEEPVGKERVGNFSGRPIISRNTSINGGVYLGAGEREAIVVDDKKYPEELNEVYGKLSRRLSGLELGKTVFDEIYDLTVDVLGGNQGKFVEGKVSEVVRIIKDKYGPREKVPLNSFIAFGFGVCRHRALLAGYLVERMIKEGKLKGSVSVDRSSVENLGGHAWMRWTGSGGRVVIIDSAMGYVGPIEKSTSFWDYRRPEELR